MSSPPLVPPHSVTILKCSTDTGENAFAKELCTRKELQRTGLEASIVDFHAARYRTEVEAGHFSMELASSLQVANVCSKSVCDLMAEVHIP